MWLVFIPISVLLPLIFKLIFKIYMLLQLKIHFIKENSCFNTKVTSTRPFQLPSPIYQGSSDDFVVYVRVSVPPTLTTWNDIDKEPYWYRVDLTRCKSASPDGVLTGNVKNWSISHRTADRPPTNLTVSNLAKEISNSTLSGALVLIKGRFNLSESYWVSLNPQTHTLSYFWPSTGLEVR